ncbi:hypothetical protein NQZ68_022124 [Dissostichus eleginoides]|nr:hypothetical protein NQZ68_022124 [Dissostichus eleginoides]
MKPLLVLCVVCTLVVLCVSMTAEQKLKNCNDVRAAYSSKGFNVNDVPNKGVNAVNTDQIGICHVKGYYIAGLDTAYCSSREICFGLPWQWGLMSCFRYGTMAEIKEKRVVFPSLQHEEPVCRLSVRNSIFLHPLLCPPKMAK